MTSSITIRGEQVRYDPSRHDPERIVAAYYQPHDMVEVSKDEFFEGIKRSGIDIMPTCDASPYYSAWVRNHYGPDSQHFGRTLPGYLCLGPKVYYLNRRLAERVMNQAPSPVVQTAT